MVVIGFAFFMASDTGKNGIVVRVYMAIETAVPFALVFAAVNSEIHPVMIEICRYPTRIGSMTFNAIGWEHCCLVIRVVRAIVIVLMTGIAIGRSIIKIIVDMTCRAILNIMTKGKWKEIMIYDSGHPARSS